MDLRTGMDDVEKRKFLTLPGLEVQPLGCPALSQSLYRLSYTLSIFEKSGNVKIIYYVNYLTEFKFDGLIVVNEFPVPLFILIHITVECIKQHKYFNNYLLRPQSF
jgi:hypothetical protein